MSLKIARFRLSLRVKEGLFLPEYKGSALRGGFGYAFRRAICVQPKYECNTCILRQKCIYTYVFDTPPPPDSSILKRISNVPHPFILEPPLTAKNAYEKGEALDFTLVLLGRAIDYLPYFIFTFDELGKIGLGKGKGKFQLDEVYSIHPEGQEKIIFYGKEKNLLDSYDLMDAREILQKKPDYKSESLTLEFLTPTRIKYEGHLISNLKFFILIMNLSRRIWLLSYFHGDEPMEMISEELIEKAKKIDTDLSELYWDDWERYSTRQNTRMNLGGFRGKISFKGELEEFMPMLYLGSIIHVGKGSGFGLGQYKLEGWSLHTLVTVGRSE